MYSIRIRKVKNGYVLSEDNGTMSISDEYVFQSLKQLYKFLNENFNNDSTL